jgi:hypothetical protein
VGDMGAWNGVRVWLWMLATYLPQRSIT